MPPAASRVLLVDHPGWARDLHEQALREAGFEVDPMSPSDDLGAALERSDPDWVFVGVAGGDVAHACRRLLAQRTRPRLLTLEPGDGASVVYELRVDETSLGVLAPAGIAARMTDLGAA